MKTSELTGALLDYWIAKAMPIPKDGGIHVGILELKLTIENYSTGTSEPWAPSTNWAQGGPIIERKNIATSNHRPGGMAAHPEWSAKMLGGSRIHFGPTLLIAAMRAYVASKFGEELTGAE